MSILAGRRTSSFHCTRCITSRERWAAFQPQGGSSRTTADSGGRPDRRRYRPGDTIRQSGIYEVVHDREHRKVHEAVMISGEKFPDCESCKEKVRFRLVRTAPYIFQDEDFEDDPV